MSARRFVPLALAAAIATTFAHAEPAITIKPVALKESAASDSKTIASLPANTTVDLMKREGAWVQLGSGSDVGWAKLFDIRLASAQTAPAKGSGAGGAGQILGLATGQRPPSVTTGVRGLDEDQLVKAQPNPQEFVKLVSFQVTKEQAQQFAATGKLTAREVELLK